MAGKHLKKLTKERRFPALLFLLFGIECFITTWQSSYRDYILLESGERIWNDIFFWNFWLRAGSYYSLFLSISPCLRYRISGIKKFPKASSGISVKENFTVRQQGQKGLPISTTIPTRFFIVWACLSRQKKKSSCPPLILMRTKAAEILWQLFFTQLTGE